MRLPLWVSCVSMGVTAHSLTLQKAESTNLNAENVPVVTAESVAAIRNAQTLWRAVDHTEEHRFKDWTVAAVKGLLNHRKVVVQPSGANGANDDPLPVDPSNPRNHLPVKILPSNIDYNALPREFDGRQKWWDCQTMAMIRDQGSCGSCWAFGTTSAISDRMCIHSRGRYQHMISALDLMSCCDYCTTKFGGYGCDGGESQDTYHYWNNTGLSSGDNYDSGLGCKPYPIAPKLIHVPSPYDSPVCTTECTNTYYNGTYLADRVRAKAVYTLKPLDTWAAMWELYHNGPLTVSYNVYKDFMAYRDGVYVRTSRELMGGHTVTIIGWGEENGVPYWTVKNSWNRLWGHHGFFKIRRGTNEAGIEEEMVGGIPDVPENEGQFDILDE